MNIKRKRLQKNMTQQELANAAGVTVRQVAKWEKFGLPKLYDRMKRLERILG
jgi:transcriptional regulator with XRE-family HTH domain